MWQPQPPRGSKRIWRSGGRWQAFCNVPAVSLPRLRNKTNLFLVMLPRKSLCNVPGSVIATSHAMFQQVSLPRKFCFKPSSLRFGRELDVDVTEFHRTVGGSPARFTQCFASTGRLRVSLPCGEGLTQTACRDHPVYPSACVQGTSCLLWHVMAVLSSSNQPASPSPFRVFSWLSGFRCPSNARNYLHPPGPDRRAGRQCMSGGCPLSNMAVSFTSRCQVATRSTLFSGTGAGKYAPRAVFVHLEPTVVTEVRTGTYQQHFHPEQLISGKRGRRKQFAQRTLHHQQGNRIIDLASDRRRKLPDNCNDLQGVLVCNACGGGTTESFVAALDSAAVATGGATFTLSCTDGREDGFMLVTSIPFTDGVTATTFSESVTESSADVASEFESQIATTFGANVTATVSGMVLSVKAIDSATSG